MAGESEEWPGLCGIEKIQQLDKYGCGVACYAMVSGIDYLKARDDFVRLGMGVRRGGKAPFSSSSGDMKMAIGFGGLAVVPRRWKGWSAFSGLGVVKVRDDWRGAIGKWHWVVAFRHSQFEIAIFDPHVEFPAFKRMPNDTLCFDFKIYEPKGEWLQVEQRVPLERLPQPH